MCMIIHKPLGEVIKQDALENSARSNSDGWGIYAQYEDRPPVILRGLDMDEGLLVVAEHNIKTCALSVHFRFTSAGKTKKAMTHPFEVGRDWWMFHNGTLQNHKRGIPQSDTAQLAEALITADVGGDQAKPILEITSSSKFLFRRGPKAVFVNSGWIDDSGCTFSNSGFRTWTSYSYNRKGRPYEAWSGTYSEQPLTSFNFTSIEHVKIFPPRADELKEEEPKSHLALWSRHDQEENNVVIEDLDPDEGLIEADLNKTFEFYNTAFDLFSAFPNVVLWLNDSIGETFNSIHNLATYWIALEEDERQHFRRTYEREYVGDVFPL